MQAAFLSLTRSSHAGCPAPWPLQVSFYFWTLVLLLPPQEHSFLSEKIRASANSWHTQATFANGKLLETCRERTFLKRRFIKKKKKIATKPETWIPSACRTGRSLNGAPRHFHPPDEIELNWGQVAAASTTSAPPTVSSSWFERKWYRILGIKEKYRTKKIPKALKKKSDFILP